MKISVLSLVRKITNPGSNHIHKRNEQLQLEVNENKDHFPTFRPPEFYLYICWEMVIPC